MISKQLMVGFIAATSLCVTASADEAPAAKDCETHFAVEGNFLTGKKYSTWIELSGVAKADAYSRVYATIAKDGWNIVNADKDSGIISASQAVSFGKGSTAPMVIVVEAGPNGSKVSATFRTGGGQSVKENTVRTKLCTYISTGAAP